MYTLLFDLFNTILAFNILRKEGFSKRGKFMRRVNAHFSPHPVVQRALHTAQFHLIEKANICNTLPTHRLGLRIVNVDEQKQRTCKIAFAGKSVHMFLSGVL